MPKHSVIALPRGDYHRFQQPFLSAKVPRNNCNITTKSCTDDGARRFAVTAWISELGGLHSP